MNAPGASAERQGDRRSASRDRRTRAEHPIVGGLLMAVRERPQHEQSWVTGADGERRLGAMLEGLRSRDVRVVHDRRVRNSRANIDHIVVAPTGVYVVDTKRYKGQLVERRGSRAAQLRVGGRDRTKLVAGMAKQTSTVRHAVGDAIPVTSVICFVDANWPLFETAFEIDGVRVAAPKVLRRWLTRRGDLAPAAVDEIFSALLRNTRPA